MLPDRMALALAKYTTHLSNCRKGSRQGMDPQATFGHKCSCGLDELLLEDTALWHAHLRTGRVMPVVTSKSSTIRRRAPKGGAA